jgi:AmmeMemoRadiSam system protein B
MQVRRPIVAGQFYPGQRDLCVSEIKDCLEARTLQQPLPEAIVAGIVPHAGWTFSGDLAALVFSAVKQRQDEIHTFIIFGAAHGYFGHAPAVYATGAWETPLGEIDIDQELAEAVTETGAAVSDAHAHHSEHSIEVQVPFIQYLFPDAKIVPILTPPREQVVTLGENIGQIINQQKNKRVVCIGSTDLTHYGPSYGFVPMGVGLSGVEWASKVNDQKFIELALNLDAEGLLKSAAENCNACGAGAAAAAVADAKALGKTKGLLLAQTNSNEVMLQKMGSASRDSVGYAAIVF